MLTVLVLFPICAMTKVPVLFRSTMLTTAVLMFFPICAMTKELNSGIYINENDTCTLILELLMTNNTSQQITSGKFEFNEVQWRQDGRGKKRGYLDTSDSKRFERDVHLSLERNGLAEVYPPRLVAYCNFHIQIPGIKLRKTPDITPILKEMWPNQYIRVDKAIKPTIEKSTPGRKHQPTSTSHLVPLDTDTSPSSGFAYDREYLTNTSSTLGPWAWVGIGAAVSANFFFIGLLTVMTLHYRKRVKELESKEIPANIISRPPLTLPPEVIYDAVYSHRINNRFPKKQRQRYISIGDITPT